MKKPETFEFNGQRMTVSQIHALVPKHHMVSKDTIRNRVRRGAKTMSEVLRPLYIKPNYAWNNSMFGKGHTA
jgi:hypothetical protein